ncbi:MAG: Ig-like domain-containing protein, partial [Bacillota bacterium]
GVPVNKTITVTFSENVLQGANFGDIALKDAGNNTVAATKSITGKVLTINPDADLFYNTAFTATIPAGAVKDAADNILASVYTFGFTTEQENDITAPTVTGTDPANNATGVPVNKTITVTFSENVLQDANFGDITLKAGTVTVSRACNISGKVLTIDPSVNLAYSTSYSVYIPAAAVKDIANNALAGSYTFDFSTQSNGGGGSGDSSGDTTPPQVKSTDPMDKAKDVRENKTITVTFDENIKEGDVAAYGKIILRDAQGKDTAFSKSISGSMLTMDPAGNLHYNETYTVSIPAGSIADTSGNKLAKDYAFSFTTGIETTVVPPFCDFTDMNDHWAKETVQQLCVQEIISGYPDGTFRPDKKITRLEAACMLVRALKTSPGTEQDLQKFKDAGSIPEWARSDAAAAAREGLIRGYPHLDGSLTFEPSKLITRTEEAALMSRVLEDKFGPIAPATLSFTDSNKIPDWAKRAVAVALAKEVIGGHPDNSFRPQDDITRAETASMILRLFKQINA